MSDTIQSLVRNLDRGFYHEVAQRQKADPGLTACAHLAALARERGLGPADKDLEQRERYYRRRFGAGHPDSRKAHYAARFAEDTWALDHALAAQGIQVVGPHSHTLDKFFTASESSVLFPAFVEMQAVIGLLEASLVPALVTQEFTVASHLVQHVRLAELDSDRRTSVSGEGARPPVVRLRTADASVRLTKYQAELQASYEALRLQRVHVVALFLQRLGAQLAADETDDLLTVAVQGDGNTGSAVTDTEATVSGTLDYREIVRLSLAFPRGYGMRSVVVNTAHLETLLALPEFKDPQAGFHYQATGEVPHFLGAEWHRWSSTGSSAFGTDRVLALDTRHALVQYTEQALAIESDRLIDRQFERTVISKWTGFGKLDYQATQCLDVVP